jgi:hypothetical protein
MWSTVYLDRSIPKMSPRLEPLSSRRCLKWKGVCSPTPEELKVFVLTPLKGMAATTTRVPAVMRHHGAHGTAMEGPGQSPGRILPAAHRHLVRTLMLVCFTRGSGDHPCCQVNAKALPSSKAWGCLHLLWIRKHCRTHSPIYPSRSGNEPFGETGKSR